MTWKKFWKHVTALIHDTRTAGYDGKSIDDWEEYQREQREQNANRQKKEQEFLATWFLREEYINAGWFKRLLLRIEFIFHDNHGEGHLPKIPDKVRMEIARCLLPDIIAFYESEKGQKEYREWTEKRMKSKSECVEEERNKMNE